MGTECVCACLNTNISKKRHLHRYLYFLCLFHHTFSHQDRNRVFLNEGLGKRSWRFWYKIRIAMTALMSSNPSWKRDVTEECVRLRVEKRNCPFMPWLFFHLAPGMMQLVHHNNPSSSWELSDLLRKGDNSKRKSSWVVPRAKLKVFGGFFCVRDTKYCLCFHTISFSLSFQKQHGFESHDRRNYSHEKMIPWVWV